MEVDSGADSVSSTPRATKLGDSVVRLMCSFGGKILPRPHDNQLRYVGGDTRIVAVHRSTTTFSTLVAKLSRLIASNFGGDEFVVKYQLPNEDLDALITVSCDEDVENMLEEFDRHLLNNRNNNSNNGSNNIYKVPRLRLFLFPDNNNESMEDVDNTTAATTRANSSSLASLLDGSRKRENWFLDALNGGAATAPQLERRRSEASSIVSEVPDYLFGLDNSDETVTRLRNRAGLGDGVPGSDPGSPAFGSSSSASQLPSLPPVKTKPENPGPNTAEAAGDPLLPQQTTGGQVWVPGLSSGPGSNPGSPYPVHNGPVPVYYVQAAPGSGQGLVQLRNTHLQPVQMPVQVPGPIPGHFVQQYGPGHVPIGYSGSGPVYGVGPIRPIGGMDPYEMQMGPSSGSGPGPSGLGQNPYEIQMGPNSGPGPSGLGQPVYYGVKTPGYPGMVLPVSSTEEVVVSGLDPQKGRILQP